MGRCHHNHHYRCCYCPPPPTGKELLGMFGAVAVMFVGWFFVGSR